MKQLPGPKSGIIRVQMDEEELKRMLQPILEEVNSLRARVSLLEDAIVRAEEFAEVTAECQHVTNNLLTTLCLDYAARQDDGK
jgi:hypothetical protein